MYISTIFVLFVQIVILMLATSLFSGLVKGDSDPMMTALLTIATLSVLLSTSKTMGLLAATSTGSQGMRKLGNTFVRGASHVATSVKQSSAKSHAPLRAGSPTVSRTRPAKPVNIVSMSSETHQVSLRKAAAALTDKKPLEHEVVVSGGAKKPKVNLTKTPIRKGNQVSKGGKK
jgi:hypothetical protein